MSKPERIWYTNTPVPFVREYDSSNLDPYLRSTPTRENAEELRKAAENWINTIDVYSQFENESPDDFTHRWEEVLGAKNNAVEKVRNLLAKIREEESE